MRLKVTVSEIVDIFKEIQGRLGRSSGMIRLDIREVVGKCFVVMINAKLPRYLGMEPYVQVAGDLDHSSDSWD